MDIWMGVELQESFILLFSWRFNRILLQTNLVDLSLNIGLLVPLITLLTIYLSSVRTHLAIKAALATGHTFPMIISEPFQALQTRRVVKAVATAVGTGYALSLN